MRRRYVWNAETKELEEIGGPTEWINTGIRYGSETLSDMKRKNLVPPSDFKETWAKAETERKRLRGELPETTAMREERTSQVREAFEKVRAGYRPIKRDNSWLK